MQPRPWDGLPMGLTRMTFAAFNGIGNYAQQITHSHTPYEFSHTPAAPSVGRPSNIRGL